MRKIIWADSALQDLARIDDWYAVAAPDFANEAGKAAIAAARFLVQYPFAGSPFKGDLRKWKVADTHYRLFYIVDDQTLEIVRLRHAREDWQSEP